MYVYTDVQTKSKKEGRVVQKENGKETKKDLNDIM